MIDVGLKEWASVCQCMGQGQWHVLFRKGGIHEIDGPGRFVLEHPRFVLFPSWLHQKPELLRSEHRSLITGSGVEPTQIPLTLMGEVPAGCIRQIRQRAKLDELHDLHGWTDEQLDMRWQYKPENPLYVLLLRVYRLSTPKTIMNNPAYGGCRSWSRYPPQTRSMIRIAPQSSAMNILLSSAGKSRHWIRNCFITTGLGGAGVGGAGVPPVNEPKAHVNRPWLFQMGMRPLAGMMPAPLRTE
ncbi:MAG: DUF1802 family protein [Phycisphaerales bacterium]|nr:DUF1802 family protein [Phycisphaerales bacterium]